MIVAVSRTVTVSTEMAHSPYASNLVNTFGTLIEYLMAAIDAPVIGKVYAHHARENLLNQEYALQSVRINSLLIKDISSKTTTVNR